MGGYIRVMRCTKNSIILSGMIILSHMCNGESRESKFNVQEDGRKEAS